MSEENLVALNVTAVNVTAVNVTAVNVTAVNVTAVNVTCGRINHGFTHAVLPPVFVAVFVVGVVSNVCGLWSVRRRHSGGRNSIGVFLLNLGLADLLYLCTLPFLVDYYRGRSLWRFGRTFCRVTRFCFHLNLYGSIGFLTCISVYRYLGIVHPLRVLGRIRRRHSLWLSLLVWVLVLVQILPDLFFEKDDERRPRSCFDTTSDRQVREYLPYSLMWTATGFGLPLAVNLLCYGHVVLVLVRKAPVDRQLELRCLRLCVVLVLLFSVCFVPYHVLRNLNLRTRVLKLDGVCRHGFQDVYMAHQVSRCLACLNSAINPLVYIVGNDEFLERLQNLSTRARLSLTTRTARYRTPAGGGATTEAHTHLTHS